MFIRTKIASDPTKPEINIMVSAITMFEPGEDNTSLVHLVTGQSIRVEASCRTIRHHVNKAAQSETTPDTQGKEA